MHSNFKAMYARLVFEYIASEQKTYMRSLTKIHRTSAKTVVLNCWVVGFGPHFSMGNMKNLRDVASERQGTQIDYCVHTKVLIFYYS